MKSISFYKKLGVVIGLLLIPFSFQVQAQVVQTEGDGLSKGIFSTLKGAAGGAFETGEKSVAGDQLLSQIFVKWMNIAIGGLGLVAVILLVYAGYLWLTAGGETGPIQKAKTVIKRVIIGMVVVGMAYGIITFALGAFIPEGQTERDGASTASDKAQPKTDE